MTNNLQLESNGRCQLNETVDIDFNAVGALFLLRILSIGKMEISLHDQWPTRATTKTEKRREKNVIDYGIVM